MKIEISERAQKWFEQGNGQLFITLKTVKTHVSNILTKLEWMIELKRQFTLSSIT